MTIQILPLPYIALLDHDALLKILFANEDLNTKIFYPYIIESKNEDFISIERIIFCFIKEITPFLPECYSKSEFLLVNKNIA